MRPGCAITLATQRYAWLGYTRDSPHVSVEQATTGIVTRLRCVSVGAYVGGAHQFTSDPLLLQAADGANTGGQAALRTTLLAGLATADRMMTAVSPSGLFLGGDCMSLADVALAPWWQRTLTGTGMSLTLMLLCTRSIRAAPVCTMRATRLYG